LELFPMASQDDYEEYFTSSLKLDNCAEWTSLSIDVLDISKFQNLGSLITLSSSLSFDNLEPSQTITIESGCKEENDFESYFTKLCQKRKWCFKTNLK
jgi:hypothetical protein